MPAPKKAAVTNATPATITQVSFDQQMQAVQDAMVARSDAETRLKPAKATLVKLLSKYGKRTVGVKLEEIDITAVTSSIVVRSEKPKITKNEEEIVKTDSYNLDRLIRDMNNNQAFAKFIGYDLTKKLQAHNDIMSRKYADAPEDKKATLAARKEVTDAFDAFMSATNDFEQHSTTIKNAKEFVGFVKDVASISAVQQGK